MSNDPYPSESQTKISEYLLLYQKLPRLRACDEEPARYFNNQHLLLEVIASAFATGHSGELFAAAFDEETNKVVLAKNGDPNEDDIAFANRLFSFVTKPEVKGTKDLFSFLQQWRPKGLKKRICQLHDAATDPTLSERLDSALSKLGPNRQIKFYGGQAFIKKNFEGKDSFFILKSCRDIITEHPPEVWDAPSMDSSTRSRLYVNIINAANVIVHCSIMPRAFDPHLGEITRDKVRKMNWHTRKASRYLSIDRVIRAAKRRSAGGEPITHRWAKSEFLGSGEGEVRLNATTAREVIHRAVGLSYIPERLLAEVLPADDEQWPTTVHTSIHPELRLIYDLGPVSTEAVHPIGLSKRSCLGCVSWIKAYNSHSEIQWMASEMSRRRPDATWAIPGNAHPIEANLADRVEGGARILLERKMDELIPEHYDDYYDYQGEVGPYKRDFL